MGFRDEFLWTGKTYAEWSLEKTTATGLRANEERLKDLQRNVKSVFEQGVDRITQGQMAAAASLQSELAYQADKIGQMIQQSSGDIVSAIEQGSADIVTSIQQMSDYLGSELCEVRWAVERHTRVSEEILKVLLNSLDNESRQFFEQGVKCYESCEFDFAKERFTKALESNRTNYFAYQYLGFVAVVEDKADEAMRNFGLARKFAESNYHQALALSHLARGSCAMGNLNQAVEFAKAATEIHPKTATFWYESASYNARIGNVEQTVMALREAIERDWTYWAVVITDKDFESVMPAIQHLLGELREREREKARKELNNLAKAIETAKEFISVDDLSSFSETQRQLEDKYQRNNVYYYRELWPVAKSSYDKVLKTTEQSLLTKIDEVNQSLSRLKASESSTIKQYSDYIAHIKGKETKPFSYALLVWIISVFSILILTLLLIASTGYSLTPTQFAQYILPFSFVLLIIPTVLAGIVYFMMSNSQRGKIEKTITEYESRRNEMLRMSSGDKATAENNLSRFQSVLKEIRSQITA
jgi:tetratricopeptide (TPR) repeat protein